MNIKILDSWLKEYLKTDASPKKIADALSLTSVSVERVEKWGSDYLYDVEVTTNRPDLASVVGLAREAGAVLPAFGIKAVFTPPKLTLPKTNTMEIVPISVAINPNLVNRITAAVLTISVNPSPRVIRDRLEASGIRSLNNVIDVTNYVMRTIGHPCHVFDYDRLGSTAMTIRESRRGEEIVTLDGKRYVLPGGDIIAENKNGEVIDLIGIMGLQNSVVTDQTKRILFFIDNNEPHHIRCTSMSLGIRTEAAQLNEKHIDPELAMDALLYGISLYEKIADGKVISDIIDIYPNRPAPKTVFVHLDKVQDVTGVLISLSDAKHILEGLGFVVKTKDTVLEADIPSFRQADITIPEDLIEEIARVYGYHNIPNRLPQTAIRPYNPEKSIYYWEKRTKEMLKYWGFTEVYTYSMVSEELYEGDTSGAVTLANPLSSDMVFMRRTLVPSLLSVMRENKQADALRIFEIANVYERKQNDLPQQQLHLAGILTGSDGTFGTVKGIFEQITKEFGISNIEYEPLTEGGIGASLNFNGKTFGSIEVFSDTAVDFEVDFELLAKQATTKKVYQKVSKFPPVIEDLALFVPENITYARIVSTIYHQSSLIRHVSLLDKYENTRTFHIEYQSNEKNLTAEDVEHVRKKILQVLQKTLHVTLKK